MTLLGIAYMALSDLGRRAVLTQSLRDASNVRIFTALDGHAIAALQIALLRDELGDTAVGESELVAVAQALTLEGPGCQRTKRRTANAACNLTTCRLVAREYQPRKTANYGTGRSAEGIFTRSISTTSA